MELLLSRLSQHHHGLSVSLKDNSDVKPIAIVNGNQPDYLGPVVLLNLDQYTVFGLSHPEVVSRLLAKGPQQMLAVKETAHNLFEHGMKASLGKIKIKNNSFITSLDTFYSLSQTTSSLQIIQGKDGKSGCLVWPRRDHSAIIICNYGFQVKDSDKFDIKNVSDIVEIDSIQTYVSYSLKPL